MSELAQTFSGKFNLSLGKFSLPVTYIQAAIVVGLVFLLILFFAKFRRHAVDWSLKGAVFGVFFGFLLALLIEGFLIIGGKTVLSSVLGWKNAPAPISIALDAGRSKLIQVLGISDEIPTSFAKEDATVNEAIDVLQGLNPSDSKKVKAIYCQ